MNVVSASLQLLCCYSRLLQLLCCCSNFDEAPKTNKAVPLESSKKQAVQPEASKKQAAKGHVCAPCDHQDAINQIKERYGGTPPHLATTVDGGKDLSM